MPMPFLLSREERLLKKMEKYLERANRMKLRGEKEEVRNIFIEILAEVELISPTITKKNEFSNMLVQMAKELIGIDFSLGMRAVYQALNLDSTNLRAYTVAASLNLWNRSYGKALEWAEKALYVSPNDKEALEIKANILESLGDIKNAVEIYRNLSKMYPQNLIYLDKILKYCPDDVDVLYQKGVALYNITKYYEAIATFKKLLSINRNNANAWIYLGICYDKISNYNEAINSFVEAVKVDPKEKNGWINLGIEYTKLGKYDEAIKSISEAISIDPSDAKLRLRRARLYINIGDSSRAIEDLNKVLLYEPENLEALTLKKNVLKNMKKYDEMLEVCNKILSIKPDDFSVLYDKAYSLYNLRRYEEAAKTLEYILRIDPIHINSLYLLLSVYKEMDVVENVVEISDRILSLRPDDWSVWLEKGRAKKKLRLYMDALYCYERALHYNNSVDILKEKLEVCKILNRFDDVIETASRILRLQPEDYTAWHEMGNAYFSKGMLDEALKALTKSLQLREDAETYNIVGLIHYRNKNYEEALRNFKRASELDSSKKKYWVNITQMSIKLGKYDEAKIAIEKAIEIDPNDYFVWLLLARILYFLGRYEEALSSINKSLEIRSDNFDSQKLKVEILYSLKRYEEALTILDELISSRADDELYYLKALILYDNGRPEEALNFVDRALLMKESEIYLELKRKILLDLKKEDELIAVCRRLIELKPKDYENYKILGRILRDKGKVEEAEMIYSAALEVFPGNLEVLDDIRIFYSRTNNYQKLIEVCDKILEIDAKNQEALMDRGRAYMHMGDFSSALKDLELAYSLTKSAEVIYYLGELYERMGKFQEAIKYFNQAYRKDKNNIYLFKIAENYFKLNDYESALKTIDKVIKLERKVEFLTLKAKILYSMGRHLEALSILEQLDGYEARLIRARCLQEMGRYEDAMEIVCGENSYEYLKLCGECQEKMNRLEDAYESYLKASFHKSSAEIYEAIGRVSMKLKKYESAIKAYEKVVASDPNRKEIWYSLGFAFEMIKDRENAIKCYDSAISLDPKDKYSWVGKGRIMLEEGKYEEALRCFERALEIDESFIEALEGKKAVEKALDEINLERYARKVLEYEFENGRRLSKREIFTKLKIPLGWVDRVYDYVKGEYDIDLSSISKEELENLEKSSIEVIRRLGENISLPAIVVSNPNIKVSEAKKLLSYIRKVLTSDIEVIVDEDLEKKLRILLSSDRQEFSIKDIVLELNVGVYEARKILEVLKRLSETQLEEDETEEYKMLGEKVRKPQNSINDEEEEI